MNKFEKFISELMYAEIYFSTSGTKLVCHFNHFRSFQKYLYFCNSSLSEVWGELNKKELLSFERHYLSLRLEEIGKLFIYEGEKVVSHRHLMIFADGVPIEFCCLNPQCRCFLSAYLSIQYNAWHNLYCLFDGSSSFYQSNYVWQWDVIAILELGDALWNLCFVQAQGPEKSKKAYLQHLFAFFNLPVPDDPCRRLNELGKRAVPYTFLMQLTEQYRQYWEEREG